MVLDGAMSGRLGSGRRSVQRLEWAERLGKGSRYSPSLAFRKKSFLCLGLNGSGGGRSRFMVLARTVAVVPLSYAIVHLL